MTREDRLARLEAAKTQLVPEMERVQRDNNLDATELLALMAFMTGIALAGQDPSVISPPQAMELIGLNIQSGNHEAAAAILRRRAN